jgi:hypothetical protein
MLEISVRRLTALLALTTAALAALDLTFRMAPLPPFPADGIIRDFFDMNREYSLPTWFSSVLLLTVATSMAVLGARLAAQRHADAGGWRLLSFLALLASIDEVAARHETLSAPLRERFGFDGFLYYAWVLPAAAFVLVLAVAFAGFVFRQPPRLRSMLLASAALFVTGALGMEVLGSSLRSAGAEGTLVFELVRTLEETLELAGVLVLLHAVLGVLARQGRPLVVKLTQADDRVRRIDEGQMAERSVNESS